MAFLPGSAAIPLNKAQWIAGVVNPNEKERTICFAQANSYFHLSFHCYGFAKPLWLRLVNIEFPRFYFNVYESEKDKKAIAHFKMDGEIKENKGKLIVTFPAPATVWRENDG